MTPVLTLVPQLGLLWLELTSRALLAGENQTKLGHYAHHFDPKRCPLAAQSAAQN